MTKDNLPERAGEYLDECEVALARLKLPPVIIDTPEIFQVMNPALPIEPSNTVLRTNFSDELAGGRIKDAMARFRELGVPFRWVVNSSSRPKNLGELLTAEGPTAIHRSVGFAAACGSLRKFSAPHVTVEELSAYNLEDFILTIKESFAEVSAASVDSFIKGAQSAVERPDPNVVHFLARYKRHPAGIGRLWLLRGKDWSAGYIGGGGVRPRFRHRGVILAVSYLAEYLQEHGIKVIMAHANVNKAAPLLRRFGFTEFGPSDYYYFT